MDETGEGGHGRGRGRGASPGTMAIVSSASESYITFRGWVVILSNARRTGTSSPRRHGLVRQHRSGYHLRGLAATTRQPLAEFIEKALRGTVVVRKTSHLPSCWSRRSAWPMAPWPTLPRPRS
eukprot:9499313-Pyramimonas_sp.AAC.1